MRIIQINISDGDHVCLDDDGGERKEDLTTMCSQSVVMQWRLLWLLVTEALIVHGMSDQSSPTEQGHIINWSIDILSIRLIRP